MSPLDAVRSGHRSACVCGVACLRFFYSGVYAVSWVSTKCVYGVIFMRRRGRGDERGDRAVCLQVARLTERVVKKGHTSFFRDK